MVEIKEGENNSSVKETNREKKKEQKKSPPELNVQHQLESLKLMQPQHQILPHRYMFYSLLGGDSRALQKVSLKLCLR